MINASLSTTSHATQPSFQSALLACCTFAVSSAFRSRAGIPTTAAEADRSDVKRPPIHHPPRTSPGLRKSSGNGGKKLFCVPGLLPLLIRGGLIPAGDDSNERFRVVIRKTRDHLSRGMDSITVPHLHIVRKDGETPMDRMLRFNLYRKQTREQQSRRSPHRFQRGTGDSFPEVAGRPRLLFFTYEKSQATVSLVRKGLP